MAAEEPVLPGFLLHAENPQAVIALVLELSELRSRALVGQALAARFHSEADWLAFINSTAFVELVDEFAQCVADIRTTVAFGPVITPETVQQAIAQHYGRALDAVGELAVDLNVDGADLLAVLVPHRGE